MASISAEHDVVLQRGWLSDMPSSFQRSVLDRCLQQMFSSGQLIYSVGDSPDGIYGLVSGGVGISVAPRKGGRYIAQYAKPGSWFGEAALITGEQRRVGLTAMRNTVLLKLPAHAIHEIVREDPATWRCFALATIRHLDAAMRTCADLRRHDPVERCIATLLSLAGHRTSCPADSPIEIDLSQENIAHLANVARTTLNAVLRDLEASGKLKRSYRRILILAPEEMRGMLRN
jgi:CRP/FNR family transcriptional regulator, cyclic AMP receptor protein